ncbi:allene oxide synthase 2-like [Phalaenopsis equestris]|uniref:allene oxide synthase 2-like n=1 Tax=Phalaenopsis equestris TaxID=78828 RepID=UPI0009E51653|nr:allene oxide synthase 2-like [Phalaenopsis equestris]
MTSNLHPSAAAAEHQSEQHPLLALPTKEIPGSYGTPFLSPIKDRLDYYYFKGKDDFFLSKINLYSSTVFRTNVPPGPFMAFMASAPRVIAVLDAKSFPILFDTSKVEKKDVFTGTYMPSTNLTGGHRVCSYLDPSEPNHTKIKQFLFNLLASRKDAIIPSFRSSYAAPIFSSIESQIASKGRADFNALNDNLAFDFISDAYFGARPSKTGDSSLPSKVTVWLLLQLAPLLSNVLTPFKVPKYVEDLLLHTFALPSIIAKPGYKKMYAYFESAGAAALDMAEKLGLSREEACHNLVFASCFNSYGGLKVLFPGVVKRLAEAGNDLHTKLAAEVRGAVAELGENGRLTVAALEKMELTNSVVYEVLRIDPPVEFQYAHAKKDFVLHSHDAAFQVRKGEMLFGYQPIATRDTRVFGADADKFVPDRFVGAEGAKLLRYVWWSNGPETESPTVNNKQCAGKNFVVLVARLLVAELFLSYDSFTADVSNFLLGSKITITSVTKAKNKLGGDHVV